MCGERAKGVENPWMVGKEEIVMELREEVTKAQERRNTEAEKERRGAANEVEEARELLKEARNEMRRIRGWERGYWSEVLQECKDAEGAGDTSKLYRCLKQLGLREAKEARRETTIMKEQFRRQLERVSEQRVLRSGRKTQMA